MLNNVVIYVDGGSRPNPGKIGWGCHGYTYIEQSAIPVKNKANQRFTTTGYVDKEEDGLTYIRPDNIIEFHGSSGLIGTNNIAEIKGLTTVLNSIIETVKDIKSVYIKVDSSYVRDGVNEWLDVWSRNNWIKRNGEVVANVDEWKKLNKVLQVLKTNGVTVTAVWVKAHSVSYGNEQADILATLGVSMAINGVYKENGELELIPWAEYKKDPPDKHPFLCYKRLYFASKIGNHIKGLYYLSSNNDDDGLVVKDAKTSFAVMHLVSSKAEPAIESFIDKRHSLTNRPPAITTIKLDRLFSRPVYHYVNKHLTHCFLEHKSVPGVLNFLDDKPISADIAPPGLALVAMNQYTELDYILCEAKKLMINKDHNTPQHINLLDITDKLYSLVVNEKANKKISKLVLKPEITDTSVIAIDVDTPNVKCTIPLHINKDTLPRNNLKRLESMAPIVWLVTWIDEPGRVRYATITSEGENIGIWSNIYSGWKLIM